MNTTHLSSGWLQAIAVLAIEGTLVALLVAALQGRFKSAVWRRTICQAGVMALLLTVICEFGGVAGKLGSWLDERRAGDAKQMAGVSREQAEEPVNFGETSYPAGDEVTRLTCSNHPEDSISPNADLNPSRPTALSLPGERAGVSAVASSTSRTASLPSDALPFLWISLLWLAGVVVVAGRAVFAQFLFLLFRLRRRLVRDTVLQERVERLARELGISRRIRLVESTQLSCPIAFGIFFPTIGLPVGFAKQYSSEKQEAMLAHELAHLAAWDPCWCLFTEAATALLWWHPAVWWLRRQLGIASELAADEASVVVADGPQVLAECLVEVGTRLAHPLLVDPLRVSGFRSQLGRRVQRLALMDEQTWTPPSRGRTALVRALGPFALAGIVILTTARLAPAVLPGGNETMKQNPFLWKQSLATVVLLTALNGAEAAPAEPATAASPTNRVKLAVEGTTIEADQINVNQTTGVVTATGSVRAQSGSAFIARAQSLASEATRMANEAHIILARADELALNAAPPTATPGASVNQPMLAANTAAPAAPDPAAAPAFAPATTSSGSSSVLPAKHGTALEAKLNNIVLEEVTFDKLPLPEVLRFLRDESAKLDSEKIGVNFILVTSPSTSAAPAVDPATGLPLPTLSSGPANMDSVTISFNLPLRHVTLKNVLDAIVRVAAPSIRYEVEDYGVVFSPTGLGNSQARMRLANVISRQPVPGNATSVFGSSAGQSQILEDTVVTRPLRQQSVVGGLDRQPQQQFQDRLVKIGSPGHPHRELPPVLEPRTFNIDFGVWRDNTSKQVGPAAVGSPGDFWNSVGIPFDDRNTESGLKFATREPSAITAELINLGGAWGFSDGMGIKSPMLDNFSYPAGNKGGNSQVILRNVPAGKYDVYIYGHGVKPDYYGDYTLSVGGTKYPRKNTYHANDSGQDTKWIEGRQYVKYSGVKVGNGEAVDILIQPGKPVTDDLNRTFSDAIISGLQLVPVK